MITVPYKLPDISTPISPQEKPSQTNHNIFLILTSTLILLFLLLGPPLCRAAASLNVTLENAFSGTPIPDLKITAKEVMSDGKLKWHSSRTTDSQGHAVFDLDGLGEGRAYTLYCTPYNGGGVFSNTIKTPQNFTFQVGTLPLQLIDGDNSVYLSDKKIVMLEKTPDGKLHWIKSGTTNADGFIFFDVPGLNAGRVYVAKAYDPFGNEKRFYSSWIIGKGEMQFFVNQGNDNPKLDLEPPWINIDKPEDDQMVADTGFTIYGRATDNREIDHIDIFISSPQLGWHAYKADFDQANHKWQSPVTVTELFAGETVTISARAVDSAYNTSTSTINLNVIHDQAPPTISINSHAANDNVSSDGFILSGTATDNTEITLLQAVLSGPLNKTVIINNNLPQYTNTGYWSLPVARELLQPETEINIKITATDRTGNLSSAEIALKIIPTQINARQLINRITFGATPNLLDKINNIGAEEFLRQQMTPGQVENMNFDYMISIFIPEERDELTWNQILYAAYSRRQLQEMMTWFWENHFSTDISSHGQIIYELNENQLFREHSLGKFRDLLTISATSPAMLYYLDNVANRRQAPNENYAREIMELHTMGVDGGYTQADIVAAARAFTGWRVHDKKFYFDAYRHDYDEKTVLGTTLPAGQGIEDGYQVIDILARHPATARHIAKKLLQYFITDTPDEKSITDVAQVFLGSDGDIARVLFKIFHLPQFNNSSNFHNKIKTPLEFTAGLLRNLPIRPIRRHLQQSMERMGMQSFYFPLPTGWPETGAKWSNSNQLLQRLLLANAIVLNEEAGIRVCSVDLKDFLIDNQVESAEEIVTFLFDLLFANDYSQLEWNLAIDILTENQTRVFDINNTDSQSRLREMTGTILSFPTYQLQ